MRHKLIGLHGGKKSALRADAGNVRLRDGKLYAQHRQLGEHISLRNKTRAELVLVVADEAAARLRKFAMLGEAFELLSIEVHFYYR